MAIIEEKNSAGKVIGYRDGKMGPLYRTLEEAEQKSTGCPIATQDIHVNLANRQHAIDEYMYGPLDPSQLNPEYWGEIADMWGVSVEQAKTARCGNCAAFNMTFKMKQCMADGIGNEPGSDAMDVVDAGNLGYCVLFKFKCAGARTCAAWVTGGPIK
jgi:hypothetical protein